MRFIFLGPPGVGKGTQAARFSKSHHIPHIATGDLLRTAISEGSDVGLEAKSYIETGKLVPDDVIIQLMNDRLHEDDARSGYILDGFPRTIAQGKALAIALDQNKESIERVFYFSLDDRILMDRIIGRRSCPSCHSIYHTVFRKPKQDNLCDCGTPLIQRRDDTPETVAKRLSTYKKETSPLITYYRELNILTEIKANETLDGVTEAIERVFKGNSSDCVFEQSEPEHTAQFGEQR